MPAFAFAIARWLAVRLPPTIHPMILHFPIVLLYLAVPLEFLALWWPNRDGFLRRAAFWTVTLACGAIIVTMAAGFVSEQSVHWTPTTAVILGHHQLLAMLTGTFAGLGWLAHMGGRVPRSQRWGLFGRGKGGLLSAVLILVAAVFVTLTAHLGGEMVYQYGVGVAGVSRQVPAA